VHTCVRAHTARGIDYNRMGAWQLKG